MAQASRIFLVLAVFAGTHAAFAAEKVEGTYLGNGRASRLAHVRIIAVDPWDGVPSYALVISEKDAAKSKRPDDDALFGRLGDALIVNITEKGDLFGTQVCHQELERAGFSTSGSVRVEDFSIANGELTARIVTGGEQDFFGDRWEIDLRVTGKLP